MRGVIIRSGGVQVPRDYKPWPRTNAAESLPPRAAGGVAAAACRPTSPRGVEEGGEREAEREAACGGTTTVPTGIMGARVAAVSKHVAQW